MSQPNLRKLEQEIIPSPAERDRLSRRHPTFHSPGPKKASPLSPNGLNTPMVGTSPTVGYGGVGPGLAPKQSHQPDRSLHGQEELVNPECSRIKADEVPSILLNSLNDLRTEFMQINQAISDTNRKFREFEEMLRGIRSSPLGQRTFLSPSSSVGSNLTEASPAPAIPKDSSGGIMSANSVVFGSKAYEDPIKNLHKSVSISHADITNIDTFDVPNVRLSTRCQIIHPNSVLILLWKPIIASFQFLILAIVLPMVISFPELSPWTILTEGVTILILSIDIVITALTMKIYDDDERIGYMIRDALYLVAGLIAVLPYMAIQSQYPQLLILHMLGLRTLPHNINTSYAIQVARNRLSERLGLSDGFWNLLALSFGLICILHWEACAVWVLGEFTSYISWTNNGTQILNKDLFGKYIFGFYTAVSNTFPLSYRTQNTAEETTFIMFVMGSTVLYASFIATITSFVGFDGSGRLFKQKMDAVNEYLRYKQVPESIRQRVRDFYMIKYRGRYFDEDMLFRELNPTITRDLVTWNCSDLINKVDFLRRSAGDGRDEIFRWKIALALVPCYYVKGEEVFRAGDEGDSMYLIEQGHVVVIVKGKVVHEVYDGEYFGGSPQQVLTLLLGLATDHHAEVALVSGGKRTATIKAAKHCIMYRLWKHDFIKIVEEFDDVKKRIELTYNARLQRVKLECLDEEAEKTERAERGTTA
ncbi:cyclic nucleotide-binding-like protein [Polychytrium aggregatum]|uniref:cyclic nucleotide-binding-like protein n=1 Tax=Polychytrium aggregatum TaxID=110093 RepID=UPI0022FED9D6|nr:cyclic nucleotide-binding-like protein [Polychytrium aggregatum]KAI9207056.1 cyclic nucleotide-binding-like protein [Polychytrium aggregatum]